MKIPNGEDIVMSKEIFDQDPTLFMNWMIGNLVVGRLLNNEGNRLQWIFDREFILDILRKEDKMTFEDYKLIQDCCI